MATWAVGAPKATGKLLMLELAYTIQTQCWAIKAHKLKGNNDQKLFTEVKVKSVTSEKFLEFCMPLDAKGWIK